jgi:hypothetical protein
VTSTVLSPVELRERGFSALVSALGWVNAVRFIQQYEVSSFDYTKERELILPNWDAKTMIQKAKELYQKKE